ncbi:MAG: hypothetical protein BWY95_01790 [Bacteroidetes bacterium ADurb.BinA104]|nr:MAG: hypothetical protein BWY95_01790 [Bacteroidetes bacterium ADurb.BinA104]
MVNRLAVNFQGSVNLGEGLFVCPGGRSLEPLKQMVKYDVGVVTVEPLFILSSCKSFFDKFKTGIVFCGVGLLNQESSHGEHAVGTVGELFQELLMQRTAFGHRPYPAFHHDVCKCLIFILRKRNLYFQVPIYVVVPVKCRYFDVIHITGINGVCLRVACFTFLDHAYDDSGIVKQGRVEHSAVPRSVNGVI